MSTRIPLFRVTTGLNTLNDPPELKHDIETGEIELAQAVNVDISNTGQRITRRKGTPRIVEGEFHSGFQAGEEILCIQELPTWASLMRLNISDSTVTGVRSGLTKHQRMHYCHIDGDTYYSNGFENGIYREGASQPWVRGEYVGHENFKELFDPPLGTHMEILGGYMLMADWNTLWVSEEFDFSAYNLANHGWHFTSRITMIVAVIDGVWIGTENTTMFLLGTEPEQWRVYKEIPYGVKDGAIVPTPISSMSLSFSGVNDANAEGHLWMSNNGVCWGGPSGQFVNITKNVLDPEPLSGNFGAAAIHGDRAIFTIEP